MRYLNQWLGEVVPGRALDLGAGKGDTALELARGGYVVDAVESDVSVYEQLARLCADTSVNPHLSDITVFPLPANTYSLIIAEAVLHFMRPTQLWPLADRLVEALAPNGLLVAEVLTTDDPEYIALKEHGAGEIEPNTFEVPDPIGLIHYFTPGELRRIFVSLEVLHYEESRQADALSEHGFRAGALLVGKRLVVA